MTKAESFFKDIKSKKIAFIGTGVSHNDLILMFLKKGFDVTVCDKKTRGQTEELASLFEKNNANLSLGEKYLEAVYKADIVFRTPGMYYYTPELIKAREMGITVTSETEVFFDLCPCKTYAVTGTDGKTTTTTIISEMLSKAGKTVHKGGNIGKALLPCIDSIDSSDTAVAELSSFQLISMRKSPDTAVITNIYPDHLNVHSGMKEYVEAKKNIIIHQNAFSKAVINYDNDETIALSSDVRGELVGFSRRGEVKNGAFLDNDGYLCYSDYGKVKKLFHKDKIKIPGMHNVENYLAAISAVWGDVPAEDMAYVAGSFGGVEHRIEFVREVNGVRYYNDSIATSPVSVIAGLNSFEQKLIVIAGGSDKNLDYNLLAESVNKRVKALILTGDTSGKIEAAVKGYSSYNPDECRIVKVGSMEDAVLTAKNTAVENDIVILSPASASFDSYVNFEQRGNHFKELVKEIK